MLLQGGDGQLNGEVDQLNGDVEDIGVDQLNGDVGLQQSVTQNTVFIKVSMTTIIIIDYALCRVNLLCVFFKTLDSIRYNLLLSRILIRF